MWFSLIVVIYTGLNPDIDVKPATVVDSAVIRGYQDPQVCDDNLRLDASNFVVAYRGEDYTITGRCFWADPRLSNFTEKRPFG